MFDLIIRGDRVVTPQGMGAWDVAVKGDQIAAIAFDAYFVFDK